MKITFFECKDYEKKRYCADLKEHTINCTSSILTAQTLKDYRDSEVISVFIRSALDKKNLAQFANLRLIVTRSTGFDHIDLEECQKRKVAVTNVPFYGENTVAEHAFALILSLSRNIHKSYVRTLKDDFTIEDLQGFDLKGKILGVIGTGHIGSHVIKMAKGFGMEVLAYDKYPDSLRADVLQFRYVSLEELLKESDIVTIHMTLTSETRHFINEESLRQMKKGAILVNTARGDIVDTDALYKVLKDKHLGGAGLDVIEGEELIKEEHELLYKTGNPEKLRTLFQDKAIFKMDNVVFTPHNAFNSREAVNRIMDTTIENIRSFSKRKIINEVKKPV